MDEPAIAPPKSSPVDLPSAPLSVEEGFVAVVSTRDVAALTPVKSVKRWKVIVALLASIASLLATVGFFVDAAVRIRGERSMDVPFPGNRRVGLFGMDGFKDWVCSEGHEHLSAPFWTGGVVAIVVTALLFLVFARLVRRPRA